MVTYLGKLCLLSNHYTAVVTLVQTLKLSEAPGVPLTNRPATPYDPVGVGKQISHLIADDEENFDEKLLNETNVFCENPPFTTPLWSKLSNRRVSETLKV